MKKNVLIVLVVLVLIGCFGCNAAGNAKVVEKADQLNPNLPYSIRANLSVVLKKGYVEDILGKADVTRKLDAKTYEIRKKADGSVIVVTYDNDSGVLLDVWRLKELYDREDFSDIIGGESSLEDVVLIDPYATVFRVSNNEGISEHRLVNDEVAVVKYEWKDGSWLVDEVSSSKDVLGFSTLISSDRNLID